MGVLHPDECLACHSSKPKRGSDQGYYGRVSSGSVGERLLWRPAESPCQATPAVYGPSNARLAACCGCQSSIYMGESHASALSLRYQFTSPTQPDVSRTILDTHGSSSTNLRRTTTSRLDPPR